MRKTVALLLCLAACGDSGADKPEEQEQDSGGGSISQDAGANDAATHQDAGSVPLDPSKIGAACTKDADCPSSTCGHSFPGGFSAPGGYCTIEPCKNSEACGGQECFGVGMSICGAVCTGDADCKRSGYQCYQPPTAMRKVCTPKEVVDFYKS